MQKTYPLQHRQGPGARWSKQAFGGCDGSPVAAYGMWRSGLCAALDSLPAATEKALTRAWPRFQDQINSPEEGSKGL